MAAIWNPFWRPIAERLPAPLAHVDHPEHRQCRQAITSTVSESAQSDCDSKEDVRAWLSYNKLPAP